MSSSRVPSVGRCCFKVAGRPVTAWAFWPGSTEAPLMLPSTSTV